MERFADHVVIARNTAQAARAHGARPVLVTSYWSYGPGDEQPMREDRPLAPGRTRRASADNKKTCCWRLARASPNSPTSSAVAPRSRS